MRRKTLYQIKYYFKLQLSSVKREVNKMVVSNYHFPINNLCFTSFTFLVVGSLVESFSLQIKNFLHDAKTMWCCRKLQCIRLSSMILLKICGTLHHFMFILHNQPSISRQLLFHLHLLHCYILLLFYFHCLFMLRESETVEHNP